MTSFLVADAQIQLAVETLARKDLTSKPTLSD
jgi:hypothetical protein